MTDRANDHREAVLACGNVGALLLCIDLPQAIDAAQRALDTGCFFNPTLWMHKSDALRQDLEMLRAALPLWKHLKKLKEMHDAEQRPEGSAKGTESATDD